jgi:hypothetical protein
MESFSSDFSASSSAAYASSSTSTSSSASNIKPILTRLEEEETKEDMIFVQDLLNKITTYNEKNNIFNKSGKNLFKSFNDICTSIDPNKIPEVTACLSDFLKRNRKN